MNWSDRTPEQKAEMVRELARKGYTASGIAQKIGVTRNSVIGCADRNNIQIGGLRPGSTKKRPPRKFNPIKFQMSPKPRPKPKPVKTIGVELMECTNGHCKWPLWEDGDPHRQCCGRKTDNPPYCADHAEQAYREPYWNGV